MCFVIANCIKFHRKLFCWFWRSISTIFTLLVSTHFMLFWSKFYQLRQVLISKNMYLHPPTLYVDAFYASIDNNCVNIWRAICMDSPGVGNKIICINVTNQFVLTNFVYHWQIKNSTEIWIQFVSTYCVSMHKRCIEIFKHFILIYFVVISNLRGVLDWVQWWFFHFCSYRILFYLDLIELFCTYYILEKKLINKYIKISYYICTNFQNKFIRHLGMQITLFGNWIQI